MSHLSSIIDFLTRIGGKFLSFTQNLLPSRFPPFSRVGRSFLRNPLKSTNYESRMERWNETRVKFDNSTALKLKATERRVNVKSSRIIISFSCRPELWNVCCQNKQRNRAKTTQNLHFIFSSSFGKQIITLGRSVFSGISNFTHSQPRLCRSDRCVGLMPCLARC